MHHVLMTGGSGGIGEAIRIALEEESFLVSNIGRQKADIRCDLADTKTLTKRVSAWLKTNKIDVLINCAGFGIFDPHETIRPEYLEELIAVNLTAPLVLSHLCLKEFKRQGKGHIINMASIEATRHARFSAAYTATKAGLRDFSLALFEETRSSNIRVSCINPDMTMTPFFEELRFAPSDETEDHITPETIAKTVLFILKNPSVICDITLRSPRFGITKKPCK